MADMSERAKCMVVAMELRLAAPAVVPSHSVMRSAMQVGVVPGLRKDGSRVAFLGNSNTESPGATGTRPMGVCATYGSAPPTVGARPIPRSTMPKPTSTPCSYMRNTGPASSHALSLVHVGSMAWRQWCSPMPSEPV